jgi:AcrR family transcriptional regulator
MSIRYRMEQTKRRLDRSDWLDAALDALHARGLGAVKVEPLAKALGVTKGSFYWHFKDLAALHAGMIAHWLEGQSAAVEMISAEAGSPEERRRLLIDRLARKDARHDIAMRSWALTNSEAADAVALIDARRIAAVRGLLAELGHSETEARFRARALYYFQIGDQMSFDRPQDSDRSKEFQQLEALVFGPA